MATDERMNDSKQEDDECHGLLFCISARAGLLVFAGVLLLGFYQGVEPVTGLFRALLALLAVTGCGWLAEHTVQRWTPSQPATSEESLPEESAGASA